MDIIYRERLMSEITVDDHFKTVETVQFFNLDIWRFFAKFNLHGQSTMIERQRSTILKVDGFIETWVLIGVEDFNLKGSAGKIYDSKGKNWT